MRAQSVESVIDEDVFVSVVDGIDTSPNGVADVAPSRFAARPSARKSRTEGLESSSCSFLHTILQGAFSKSADLAFFMEQQGFPKIVCFTATFLDRQAD